jgi:hypothetical protein
MSFLTRIERDRAEAITLPVMATPQADAKGFTPLEWSVIRLARVDRLWTARPLGPLRQFWNWWTGIGNVELANERLEALRKIAVLSWYLDFNVPERDVAAFLKAGFSADQYELLVSTVLDAQRPLAEPGLKRVFG